MIDWAFIVNNLGLPALGGFLGSIVGNYLACPNRGCCQMKKIQKVIEDGR